MIEVVKHGKRYQITCKYCGCIFRYSRKDEKWTGLSSDSRYVHCPDCGRGNDIIDPLEVKPIVDDMMAVEVGEWIPTYRRIQTSEMSKVDPTTFYTCSHCSKSIDWTTKRYKYCPNCGVPMTNSED